MIIVCPWPIIASWLMFHEEGTTTHLHIGTFYKNKAWCCLHLPFLILDVCLVRIYFVFQLNIQHCFNESFVASGNLHSSHLLLSIKRIYYQSKLWFRCTQTCFKLQMSYFYDSHEFKTWWNYSIIIITSYPQVRSIVFRKYVTQTSFTFICRNLWRSFCFNYN